MTMFTVPDCC